MNALEQQDLYAALLHEMKNILVLMAMTMERVPHTQTVEHDQPLDEVRRLCQRASERLMQALMIYKSDSGGMVLNAVDAHSPEDFIAVMAIHARYLQTPLEIETWIDPNVPAIWFFDHNMLELALINAIHNSIMYARKKVVISARVEDGMLCVAVSDDSDGYPAHILQAVAEDKPLNTSGTGLGLRFASLIAKAHENNGRRGFLSLSNQNGSIFEIRIP